MTARILPLSAIKGLGPARIKALGQAGVMTVEDLLAQFEKASGRELSNDRMLLT